MSEANMMIAMVQAGNLLLVQPRLGKQTLIQIGDVIYAAEVAEAINGVMTNYADAMIAARKKGPSDE